MYTGNIPIIILLDRQINFFPSVTVIRVEIFPINESCSEIHCFHMVKIARWRRTCLSTQTGFFPALWNYQTHNQE
jgi:hypothetical protein